ncbi:GtrA family protein [Streptomyces sp. NPDC026206]|uniref:GtrA family protein n=1 Tax=Streptomyces sp. NPDC026206 TaxID=3157089 RepID=UPI003407A7AB
MPRRRPQGTDGEIVRFGAVGSMGWIVDTAVFNACLHLLHLQPVRSGLIASAVAVLATYLGNRYWTYRSRSSSRRSREFALFVVFSGIGMAIQNGILALSHYGFGYTSALSDNAAKNVAGLGLATLFRFWAYRTWVFRAAPVRTDVAAPHGIPGDERRAAAGPAGRVHR